MVRIGIWRDEDEETESVYCTDRVKRVSGGEPRRGRRRTRLDAHRAFDGDNRHLIGASECGP